MFYYPTTEYDHVLSLEEQSKLTEAATEMETNASYGLRDEDQLQAEQKTMETNLVYGLRSEHDLQVIESAHHFNSDPQQSESEPRNGNRGVRTATGYTNVMYRRRSSYQTSV